MPQDEQLAEAIVVRLKEACDKLSSGVRISTSDLVKRAFPHEIVSQRLAFSLLTRPPATFDGYWTRGVSVKGKFGPKRPYLWHALLPICPHCHGSGRMARTLPPKSALTWADFDMLYDAAKEAASALPERKTQEDIESYRIEIARREYAAFEAWVDANFQRDEDGNPPEGATLEVFRLARETW